MITYHDEIMEEEVIRHFTMVEQEREEIDIWNLALEANGHSYQEPLEDLEEDA